MEEHVTEESSQVLFTTLSLRAEKWIYTLYKIGRMTTWEKVLFYLDFLC